MVRTVDTADELLAFLRNWNVDGLFVTGIFRDSFFDTLSTLDLPMVFIDSYVKHPNFYNVGLEDFNGSFLATSHLIENGHRKIAFTSPSIRDGGVLQERFLGYKAALTQYGLRLINISFLNTKWIFLPAGSLQNSLQQFLISPALLPPLTSWLPVL